MDDDFIDGGPLAAIQSHFHHLIAARAEGLVEKHHLRLPELRGLKTSKAEPAWFPVPGMCGGFAYWFDDRGGNRVLIAESWSRVAEGSGQRHEITPEGARLISEGFV
ncbi:MAG: hypothetical protein ABIR59_08590 [Gemmatimonadales bacterium]